MNRNLGFVSALVSLVAAAFFVFPAFAFATGNTWNVDTTGTDNTSCGVSTGTAACKTIQYTIDNRATSGDTISVAAGTYPETVSVPISLTINGAQAGIAVSGRTFSNASESIVDGMNITASNVIIDGFSFNNAGSQININGATTLSGVVVQNNIFSGYSSVGIPTYNAGNLLITKNLFENPLSSTEAMQIKASAATPGGCNGTVVSDNVFTAATNNTGAEINFSCTDSGSTGVTVSGNTDTGLAGDGPSFTAFSGVTGGIFVTNNNVTDTSTSGSAVFFFGSVSGTVSITGNQITGDSGSSAVSIHGNDNLGTDDSTNTGTFTITSNVLSGNSNGIYISANALGSGAQVTANKNDLSGDTFGIDNANSAEIVADGSCNWWGDTSGPGPVAGPGSGSGVTTNVNFANWLLSSDLSGSCTGGTPPPSSTVTVTIDKFIDGVAATTTTATASFPMLSTTLASNINGGVQSGPNAYTLGTSDSYEAITSPMNSGATYTTNEVTAPSSVVDADCTTGDPYELVGYSYGPDLATAKAATPSATVPNFTNLTSNEYVIVWNKNCLPTPTITVPTNASTVTTAAMVEVDWNAVTDPAGGITYIYQASNSPATNTDGSFVSPVYTSPSPLTATSIPTPGTPPGVYYLQVQAKDADGNVSAWSPTVMVTVSNTVTPPACNPDASQTIVSDTSTTFNGTDGTGNAVAVTLTSITSTYWTASIPGATWIWSTAVVADSTINDTETFTRTFTITGTPLESTLMIAADNYYSVSINGNDLSGTNGTATDNNFTTAATYDVPATDLVTGTNTLTIVGENEGISGSNPTSNPAGVLYSLTVNNNECVLPPTTATLTITKETSGGNGSGTYDFTSNIPGYPTFSITTTKHEGTMTFNNLPPGPYTVTEVNIPKGWTETDNSCTGLNLAAGDNFPCVVTNTNDRLLGSIRGTKYEDRDGDGTLKDGDHHKLSGVTINLAKSSTPSTIIATAVTNKQGFYDFTGLVAGNYQVCEVVPSGWTQTYPGGNGCWTVNLSAGQNAKKKDFGDFKPGTISGVKYNDANGDGKKDNGEVGITGVTINIKGPHGYTNSAVTASDGSYSFTNLGPGTYTLSEVIPTATPAWHQTQHPGPVKIESSTNATKENFGNTQRTKDKDGDYDGDNGNNNGFGNNNNH